MNIKSTRDYEVSSFEQFHSVLTQFRGKRWYFRGHSSLEWSLVPKAGRPPFDALDDREYLETWKRRARAYTATSGLSDWDWLALAQHHGLATRLLDWSVNPLAAALFAVDGAPRESACVYAFRASKIALIDNVSPFKFDGIAVFKPTAVVDRIVQQGGMFTVHGPPSIALNKSLGDDEELCRIVITQAYRDRLQAELDFYYVNATSLFPGLDGLSRYMNWWYASRERSPDSNLEALDG